MPQTIHSNPESDTVVFVTGCKRLSQNPVSQATCPRPGSRTVGFVTAFKKLYHVTRDSRPLCRKNVAKNQRLRLHITGRGLWFHGPTGCRPARLSLALLGERIMKRLGIWLFVGLTAMVTIGCSSGRTSWFNRGAPCSTCGAGAPVYNGAVYAPGTMPPSPPPEVVAPAG